MRTYERMRPIGREPFKSYHARGRIPGVNLIWTAAFLLCGVPSLASSQICASRPSFDSRSTQLRGALLVSSSSNHLGGGVAYGTDRLFGVVETTYDALAVTPQRVIGAGAGTDQPLTLDNRWHLCPIVNVEYRWRSTPGADLRLFGVGAEGRLGWLARNGSSAAIEPAIALAVRRHYAVGGSAEGNEGSIVSSASLGIVLRNGLAFRPAVTVPITGKGGQWIFTAEVSLNLSSPSSLAPSTFRSANTRPAGEKPS